jgi:phospholipid transport system substrate-binding protein
MDRLYLARNLLPYLLALTLLCGSNAIAGAPTDEIRYTVDRVIEILTDPRYEGEANKKERRALLRETISPRFDFEEMARRALGAEWSRRTAEELSEFVKIFTEFVEETAVINIESYDGERFVYSAEKIDDPYAEVNGTIFSRENDETKINYLFHRVDSEWKAYDLVIDGISFVGNYRAQFHRLIRQSSYEGLVQRIRKKLADKKG